MRISGISIMVPAGMHSVFPTTLCFEKPEEQTK